jgi:hypothetical protein
MIIDEVYKLVNFVADKNGRGYVPPARFNLLAKIAQLEFISIRLGNIKALNERGVPPFGYKSNRRIDVDLRPFVYGPETISITNQGNFVYPYGFMWPDAWHKNDFSVIEEIDSDEYPRVKHSQIYPPTEDFPILIFRNPYGFIDPYSIGSFKMSYVKYPSDPVWGFSVVNNEEVFNEAASVDFTFSPINMLDVTILILEKVGINLDKPQLLQYAQLKQAQGT